MDSVGNKELLEHREHQQLVGWSPINSDASSGTADGELGQGYDDGGLPTKRQKTGPNGPSSLQLITAASPAAGEIQICKQFWKAGGYEVEPAAHWASSSGGMEHVRVHPKFLHSNATSHKWILGAIAELLDNSVDEICHGATFINIDMLMNKKNGSKMLLVEDDGCGMNPDRLRQCISLGYSMKNKSANTIGQYGNGFKTSTMRLGADVIVFSRCAGKGGRSPTQSIGLLSYTFLRKTRKEDIVVPMIDYKKEGEVWNKLTQSSSAVWNNSLEAIVQWSPYFNEADLLQQFGSMTNHGTRIIIYNLWEDDQGELELDFDADNHDIQVRGVNLDEDMIKRAKQFPNSKHFLTYRYSLRSYASILYLQLPHHFRMILRGKEIEHHNLVNDMMLKQEMVYRPQPGANGVPRYQNIISVVTIGFVKDAKDHINVQGFNIYHKNRLIKPFWRVLNAAGSDGRGVIGILEANFVEPSHDKQDFEHTTVLLRLVTRLQQMQKEYWTKNCHKIGYVPQRDRKTHTHESGDKESSLENSQPPSQHFTMESGNKASDEIRDGNVAKSFKLLEDENKTLKERMSKIKEFLSCQYQKVIDRNKALAEQLEATKRKLEEANKELESLKEANKKKVPLIDLFSEERCWRDKDGENFWKKLRASDEIRVGNGAKSFKLLEDENRTPKERITKIKEFLSCQFKYATDKYKALAGQLEATKWKLEEANKEKGSLIDLFSKERCQRDKYEENLTKKLKDASKIIQVLAEKLSSGQNIKPKQLLDAELYESFFALSFPLSLKYH